MNIRDLPAIDVHAHFGYFARPNLPKLTQEFGSGDARTVVARAASAIWNRCWHSWAQMIARCKYGQARNAASYASRKKQAKLNTS